MYVIANNIYLSFLLDVYRYRPGGVSYIKTVLHDMYIQRYDLTR